MNDNGTTSMPPASVAAAPLSIVGGAVFVAALALLHILKPEVDVWSLMISEYAIGRHGWLMTLAFLALGARCTSFMATIRPSVPARRIARSGEWRLIDHLPFLSCEEEDRPTWLAMTPSRA